MLAAAMLFNTVNNLRTTAQKEIWRDAADHVLKQAAPGDFILFYASFMADSAKHYLRGYPQGEAPEQYQYFGIQRDESRFSESFERFSTALAKAPQAKVWVFYSHIPDASPLEKALNESGLIQMGRWSGKGILMKSYLQRSRPTPAKPDAN